MAWTTPRDWTGISDDIVTAAQLNVDIRDNLGVLSTHSHTGAAGQGATSMTGLALAALATLTFANQSANPDAAGELQRNGNDLLFFGASAVNLTQADASAGTASLRTLGTTSVKAAAGNHTHDLDTPSVSNLTGVYVDESSSVRTYKYKEYTTGQIIDGSERQVIPTNAKNLVLIYSLVVAPTIADMANIDLQEAGVVILSGLDTRVVENTVLSPNMVYAIDFTQRPNKSVGTHIYKLVATDTVQVSACYLFGASVQTA